MIDAHIHLVPPRLKGVGSLHTALELNADQRVEVLRQTMREAKIETALAMGEMPTNEDDPLGVAATLALADSVPGVYAIGVMDPTRSTSEHMHRVEAVVRDPRVIALKGYLGYLHCGPDHPGYRPYYELAERHRLPVIFHTGDTYSPRAKLRYAQPLLVDEVAVDHPHVNFVLAHLGYPWVQDAAEVVYKNFNVWTDLSGLVVGEAERFSEEEYQDTLADVRGAVQQAFRYAERPNRFVYGSDWPLVPMRAYREFIASAFDEMYHELLFEENAQMLFRL